MSIDDHQRELSRRAFMREGALGLGALGLGGGALLGAPAGREGAADPRHVPPEPGDITFPPILSETERQDSPPPNPRPPSDRVGYAVVGLGRIALNQVIPALAQCKRSKLAAVVSGDPAKAATVARQHGLDDRHVFSYQTFDQLRNAADVDAVYIALPNSMHAEYTVRGAGAGKHVLCEKPMATTVADADRMVAACKSAGRQLMIAYRIQYEPHNRHAMQLVRAGELGRTKMIEMVNGQDQGDPNQWRLRQAMSGGGSLPDVGIYCLNTARFLLGEEPVAVSAMMVAAPNDPRFHDVPEESIIFQLRFPGGVIVNAASSYGTHRAQRYRVLAENGWIELDPAFPYRGIRMRVGRAVGKSERIETREFEEKSQFSLEIDHFSQCIRENKRPYTPGEEGAQDMRLITAIYEAARASKPVAMSAVAARDAFRGTEPSE